MTEALTSKNTEIESLVGTVDTLKKQTSISEGKFISLQANMEAVMRNMELAESRMIEALREELATVERRAEEERVAHNATKMDAMEREVELEHRSVEASNALVRIQRTADESTSRVAELEHKVALLEVECASLTQELQEMEARNRRGHVKASEESSQILQMQAWQEEVERAQQCKREVENKISSMEAELQKMRVEIAGMKRDAEHYSRQEHMELEKRYRELTDLLYHKQTQLEVNVSKKAATEFQLEKEIKRLQEVEAERSRAFRRSPALWEEEALEDKNLEIKKITDEKKATLPAQFAAEATLRRVHAAQKDEELSPLEAILSPLEAEIKLLRLELTKLQDDNKALDRLTKSKEVAQLEAEREVQLANEKATLVDDLLNKKQELTKQSDICQEEYKILDRMHSHKVAEVEKLGQTIHELEEVLLSGAAAANAVRDYQRQVNELKGEKKTLERALSRVMVTENRVAIAIANEWKDANDKVIPLKQWLEERRILVGEMQQIRDKLTIAERATKAEAQLKERFQFRWKVGGDHVAVDILLFDVLDISSGILQLLENQSCTHIDLGGGAIY